MKFEVFESVGSDLFRDRRSSSPLTSGGNTLDLLCKILGKSSKMLPVMVWSGVLVCNTHTSACPFEALKYVSFTQQMLEKTLKTKMALFWGMAVG